MSSRFQQAVGEGVVDMTVKSEPSKHWCRKMRTVFRPWDVEAGSKGYITLEDLENRVSSTLEKFPGLADEGQLLERARRTWVDFCNCGVEMPKGYRLTEAQFVQNVWLTVHKPSFEEYLREASAQFVAGVDKEKKGYCTREESQFKGLLPRP